MIRRSDKWSFASILRQCIVSIEDMTKKTNKKHILFFYFNAQKDSFTLNWAK